MTPQDPYDEFEHDPTGIRAILRSLPDPGPMPSHVSDSIEAALRREATSGRSEDIEHDPTGIRAILRSLPDPGPMPSHVSDSIEAALRREAEGRTVDSSNVTPLRSRDIPHRSSSGASAASTTSATSTASAGRRGRPRWMSAVAGVAAAAAIGTVAVIGYQQSQPSAPPANAVASSTVPAYVADKVGVRSTGVNYNHENLATKAAAIKDAKGLTPDQVQQLGSLATREGAASCARSIGGSLFDHPDHVSIDIATYNGTPALIVVIEKDGKSTAWVVSRTCNATQKPLDGPTTVA